MTAASIEQAGERGVSVALGLILLVYLAWLPGLGSGVLGGLTLLLIGGIAMLFAREVAAGRWLAPAVLACLAIVASGSPTVHWDARSIWLFHAKRIYTERTLLAQLDGYASWSHNDYPALIPALSASLATLLGDWNELVPKLAGTLAMAPALVVLSWKLPFQWMAAWLVLLLFCAGQLLVNGYVDAVLAVYFVAAFACMLELMRPAEGAGEASPPLPARSLLLPCLVFTVLTLLKNEAVLALGAVVFSVVLITLRRGGRLDARFVMGLGLAMLPLVHWKWVTISHDIGDALTTSSVGTRALARIQDPYALALALRSMALSWPIPIPACLFAAVVFRFRSYPSMHAAALAAGAYSAILFAAYLATPWDLEWHLETSVDRTMLPVGMLLGYAALSHLCLHPWRGEGRHAGLQATD